MRLPELEKFYKIVLRSVSGFDLKVRLVNKVIGCLPNGEDPQIIYSRVRCVKC